MQLRLLQYRRQLGFKGKEMSVLNSIKEEITKSLVAKAFTYINIYYKAGDKVNASKWIEHIRVHLEARKQTQQERKLLNEHTEFIINEAISELEVFKISLNS